MSVFLCGNSFFGTLNYKTQIIKNMKKLFILFVIFLLSFPLCLNAQLDLKGTKDYGRIFNITYDMVIENRLYSTTIYNHILVSNDNGQSWDVLHSFPVTESIIVEQLRQLDPETLTFVQKNLDSTDNKVVFYDLESGQVTKEIYPPSQMEGVNEIKSYSVYGPDTDVMILHVNYNWGEKELVFYSTDGAENWEVIYNHSEHNYLPVNNAVISPFNPQKIFLARANNFMVGPGGLLMSEDAGASWSEVISGVSLNQIEFNAFNPSDILVGTDMNFSIETEAVYRSLDAGQTWTTLPITWTAGVTEEITQIKFNPHNYNNIIVLEENEVIISNDNGATWTSQVYDMEDSFQYYSGYGLTFNPFVPNELFISGNYYPFHSTDGGMNLKQLKNPFFEATGGMAIFQNDLYYGINSGYVKLDLNSMEELHIDILPVGAVFISPEDEIFTDKNLAGRVYTFTGGWMGSKIFMSDNHGLNKTEIMSTFMDYLDFATSDPQNQDIIWASVSNNMGGSEIYKIDVSDLNNITHTTIIPPQQGVINAIHINSENSDQVLITVGNKIFKSENSGETWEVFGNGLEMALSANDLIMKLVQSTSDANYFALATSQGLFLSTDGGANWTQKTYELIQNVLISGYNESHIVGVVNTTHYSELKLIFSDDKGETWSEISSSSDLYNLAAHKSAIHFGEDFAEIYLGSYDMGIVKVKVDFETLSVSEPAFLAQKSARIYPNPATDFVNIQSKFQINLIEIYSLSGQKILSAISDKLNISHLNKGIYLVKIHFPNGKTETQKLIKK